MYLNGETNNIGEKDINRFITAQNNKNIAEQAHGFVGVNNAMKEYNKLSDAGAKNTLTDEIKNTNQSLGTYLSNLDNADAGMGGYCRSLLAAKAGTMALEVATTAMNAVIGMGVSLIITGIVNAISNWIHADEQLAESAKTAAENIKIHIKSKTHVCVCMRM